MQMDETLLIISVYDDLLKNIERVCNDLNISPAIIEWEQATQELISLLNERFAKTAPPYVIISRGAVASLIEQNFKNIVVIRAEPDDTDLLESMEQAKLIGPKIGLLLYAAHAYRYKANVVKRILSLDELKIYPFQSKADIENMIAQGIRDGMNAMVGGGTLGQRTGKRLGIPVVFAKTGARSIQHAITQAIAIINTRQNENLQLRYFQTAISSIDEGVMTLKNQRITLVNKKLADIMKVSLEESIGADVRRLVGTKLPANIYGFLQQSSPEEEIFKINNNSFLVKKIEIFNEQNSNEAIVIFKDVTEIQQQEQKIRRELQTKGLVAKYHFEDVIGNSSAIKTLISNAAIFASTDANILIAGDSGTGKELIAQSIHNASARKHQPFVAINCAAIPEALLESELFGYEDGAFTGARKGGKAGLFELAHKGTIFLDEINSLPIVLQGVLLRVIQEKEIRKIGASSILSVDTRIISATNKDMSQLVKDGQFRPDLYYRLNILNLQVPSLAQRSEDVLELAEYFIEIYSRKYNLPAFPLSENDKRMLLNIGWKGNVRELENVVHRFVILANRHGTSNTIAGCLDVENSNPSLPKPDNNCVTVPKGTLQEMENAIIQKIMAENGNNQLKVSDKLGICRTTLWKRLRKIDAVH